MCSLPASRKQNEGAPHRSITRRQVTTQRVKTYRRSLLSIEGGHKSRQYRQTASGQRIWAWGTKLAHDVRTYVIPAIFALDQGTGLYTHENDTGSCCKPSEKKRIALRSLRSTVVLIIRDVAVLDVPNDGRIVSMVGERVVPFDT